MHYLGLALYAEGSTDYSFLRPLLLRLCEDLCVEADSPVDIGEILALDHPLSMAGASRAERIARAAQDAAPAWNILFVHADADGDAKSALRERIEPGLCLVRQAGIDRTEGVAVIPVRETEAWAVADADAVRNVMGTTLDDERLGLTVRGRALEGVTNPKAILETAFNAAGMGPRRKRINVAALFNALGEQVALQILRCLPSFVSMENELRAALQRLQILPAV